MRKKRQCRVINRPNLASCLWGVTLNFIYLSIQKCTVKKIISLVWEAYSLFHCRVPKVYEHRVFL